MKNIASDINPKIHPDMHHIICDDKYGYRDIKEFLKPLARQSIHQTIHLKMLEDV